MGSKRDQRAQKKREKDRKKRERAQRNRGSRAAPEVAMRSKGLAAAECAAWPLGECYLSMNWHEHGPRLHACISRVHTDGRVAAGFCEIDLGGAGVVEAMFRSPVSADAMLGEVARRSEEQAMQLEDPLRVGKVIDVGAGLGVVDGFEEVRTLLGDLDVRACPDEILTGSPPPPKPKKKSLFSAVFGLFGAE